MYVHNNSVQSVDSSEQKIAMLCAYLSSYCIGFLLLFYSLFANCRASESREPNSFELFAERSRQWIFVKSGAKVQIKNEIFLRSCKNLLSICSFSEICACNSIKVMPILVSLQSFTCCICECTSTSGNW